MIHLEDTPFLRYPDGQESIRASDWKRALGTSMALHFRKKNMMGTPALVMVTFLLIISGVAATDWNYENQDAWGDFCNTGRRQSPLNFERVSPASFSSFTFKNYGLVNTSLEIENNGLNVNLVHLSPNPPHILGGGLTGKYVLESFHFHWGSENSIGSEHRLLGCSFAGEMHFVHFKEEYRNVKEARKHQDGVAVLAVWLKASEIDSDNAFLLPEGTGHDGESEIFHSASTNYWLLEILPKNGIYVNGSPGRTKLREILPRNDGIFYRYNGSLTTPPCSPTVVWTVFRDTVLAPRRLLHFLRSLKKSSNDWSDDSQTLSNNFRDIQEQGARTVHFSGRLGRHFAECDNEIE